MHLSMITRIKSRVTPSSNSSSPTLSVNAPFSSNNNNKISQTPTNMDTTNNGLTRRHTVSAMILVLPNGNHHRHRNNHHKIPDFELVSLNFPSSASYTSLKDIIDTSCCPSPPASADSDVMMVSSPLSGSGYEISIRNHLVKQAAWAYLQPAVSSSSSPSSSSSKCLCFSREFYRRIFGNFRQFAFETATRVYDWLVDVLWLILCR